MGSCGEGGECGTGGDGVGEGAAVAVEDLVGFESSDGVLDVDPLAGDFGVEVAFGLDDRFGPFVASLPFRGERFFETESGFDPDVRLVREHGHLGIRERRRGAGLGDPGQVMGRAGDRRGDPQQATLVVGDRLERVDVPVAMTRVLGLLHFPAALAGPGDRHEAPIDDRGTLRRGQLGQLVPQRRLVPDPAPIRCGDPHWRNCASDNNDGRRAAPEVMPHHFSCSRPPIERPAH